MSQPLQPLPPWPLRARPLKCNSRHHQRQRHLMQRQVYFRLLQAFLSRKPHRRCWRECSREHLRFLHISWRRWFVCFFAPGSTMHQVGPFSKSHQRGRSALGLGWIRGNKNNAPSPRSHLRQFCALFKGKLALMTGLGSGQEFVSHSKLQKVQVRTRAQCFLI